MLLCCALRVYAAPDDTATQTNSGDEAPVELEPLTVYRRKDAFTESDRKLRQMQESLPALATENGLGDDRSLGQKLTEYVIGGFLPAEPANHADDTPEDRALNQAQGLQEQQRAAHRP